MSSIVHSVHVFHLRNFIVTVFFPFSFLFLMYKHFIWYIIEIITQCTLKYSESNESVKRFIQQKENHSQFKSMWKNTPFRYGLVNGIQSATVGFRKWDLYEVGHGICIVSSPLAYKLFWYFAICYKIFVANIAKHVINNKRAF